MPDINIFRVRQKWERPRVEDVAAETHAQMARLELEKTVRPGQSVAITGGSRGIRDIATVTRAIVEHFHSIGAEPFVVPAMGSHGSGTAEGQRHILESYGMTEQSLGCPVRSNVEAIEVARVLDDVPLYFDREASAADHVFLCNRVKPHTRFSGPIESGLLKMLTIGLGKPCGARTYHKAILRCGFDAFLAAAVPVLLANRPILGGLAIVENAYDETACIEAIPVGELESRERKLLEKAKRWMPRLPFNDVELLLIDRIGKDISGTGLDSNVVGRKNDDHKAVGDERPNVRRIAVRDLTDATDGNANGLGMTEFCKSSILKKMDVAATRLNAMTADHVSAAMIPLDHATDREIVETAAVSMDIDVLSSMRMLWISDTLHLEEVECGEAFWAEASDRDDLEVLTPPRTCPFDADGQLPASMLRRS